MLPVQCAYQLSSQAAESSSYATWPRSSQLVLLLFHYKDPYAVFVSLRMRQ